MTTSTLEAPTTERELATLDTPEGTIIRLREERPLFCPAGALAFVGDGSGTSNPGAFLDVRWLCGHGDSASMRVQSDGGYYPDGFEIFGFQIGDRVRVHGQASVVEGSIYSVPAPNGEDCLVHLDGGEALPFAFADLELLSLPEKGDVLVLDPRVSNAWKNQWRGLRVRFINTWADDYFVKPLGLRPDGFDRSSFYWSASDFRPFDPKRDFRVGDRVVADFGMGQVKGYVTRLDGTFGADIEVAWISGFALAGKTLGTTRKNLTLIDGDHEKVFSFPGYEDFTFEAGQEIGSPDVLDELPTGTVLIEPGLDDLPIIKLSGRFGSLNPYDEGPTETDPLPISYYEDEYVRRVLEDGDPLMIAYVPALSN